MIRLISIIAIAIAMVIGFVAISTQMKDDYTVRSLVVDILDQMKNVAAEELQCQSDNPEDISQPSLQPEETADTPTVEINPDLEITPLVGEPDTSSSEPQASNTNNEDQQPETSVTQSEPHNEAITDQEKPSDDLEQLSLDIYEDTIQTMGYRALDNGAVEVITILKNIKGESEKVRIKSGSRIVIHCSCIDKEMSCKTVISDINKNYLPVNLTKQ